MKCWHSLPITEKIRLDEEDTKMREPTEKEMVAGISDGFSKHIGRMGEFKTLSDEQILRAISVGVERAVAECLKKHGITVPNTSLNGGGTQSAPVDCSRISEQVPGYADDGTDLRYFGDQ